MASLTSMLMGAVSMSSLLVALFFLRFWSKTRDRFFLIFAVAFAIYAVSQMALGLINISEFEPLFYVPRVLVFLLIVLAVVEKNRTR